MLIINCEQRDETWFNVRCGIPTSSNFDKLITVKGERSKQREKYLYQLAGEKIIGRPEEGYTNAVMQKGIELEAEARQFYELITGKSIRQVGFYCTEGKFVYGASPDGLVDNDGLLEIKCPCLSTHVSYLIANELPVEYFQQVQGQMLVTEKKFVDFVSYYPGLKPLIVRVKPDKDFLVVLKKEIEAFCVDLNEIAKKLKEKNDGI